MSNTSPLPPLRKKKPFSIKNAIFYLLRILCFFLIVLGISCGSQILYWRYRYQSFVVNGSSMYPTLNFDAEMFIDGVKQEIPASELGGFHGGDNVVYHCDYGLADSSDDFVSKLDRFSIVLTYYENDFDSQGIVRDGASLKVKRILGLPGETVYFDENGDFYVNDELVPQDFLKGTALEIFESTKKETGATKAITLKEDEYYLVGDNRKEGASDDSRFEGPIKESWLIAKAVGIVGKCAYEPSGGTTTFLSYRYPWEVQLL